MKFSTPVVIVVDRDTKVDSNGKVRKYIQPVTDHFGIRVLVTPYPVIENSKDVVYILTGKEGVKWLSDRKVVRKGSSVKSVSSRAYLYNGSFYIVTEDVMDTNLKEVVISEIRWAARLACRVYITGSPNPVLGRYRYVKNFSEAIDYINRRDKPVTVSLDLETIGLDPFHKYIQEQPYNARIVSIAVSYKAGMSDVWYTLSEKMTKQDLYQIKFLVTSPKVKLTGANLKFDAIWLNVQWGIEIQNQTFDTNLVGSLLDENRSNSLNMHAKVYTDLGGYDDSFNRLYDKGRMDKVPVEALLPYAGGDTDACYQVSLKMKKALVRNKSLQKFFTRVVMPANKAISKLEYRGVVVDLEVYKKLEIEFTKKAQDITAELMGLVPKTVRNKYPSATDFNSDGIIVDFLFSKQGLGLKPLLKTVKTKKPSCSGEHYERLVENHPNNEALKKFVDLMKDYNSTTKSLSTYISGFMNHIRSDGRFHPLYNLFKSYDGGTLTGRLSANNPAWQCQPEYSMILTDKGYKSIRYVIDRLRKGLRVNVLSHDGKYHKVTDWYDNGVKDVLRVTLNNGYRVDCTGNHPLLTVRGWVIANELLLGDSVFTYSFFRSLYASISRLSRAEIWKIVCCKEERDKVSCMLGMFVRLWKDSISNSWEFKVREYKNLWLFLGGGKKEAWASKWKSGLRSYDSDLSILDGNEGSMFKSEQRFLQVLWRSWDICLRKVDEVQEFFGGYGGKTGRLFFGKSGCRWELLSRELQVDSERRAEFEQKEFKEKQVVSIVSIGELQTYGLSVEESYTYISEGVIVHNTVPKHTKYAKILRSPVIPPPGFSILKLDYSQGELRIVADVANEKTMLRAFKNNEDLHKLTACAANNMTLEMLYKLPKEKQETLRFGGKAGNFGLVYKISPKGFMYYAKTTYGVTMTLQEAEEYHSSYFGLYSGLGDWHDECISIARQYGKIINKLGRPRHLPLIHSPDFSVRSKQERRAINSGIQSCLSDMMLLALVELDRIYPDLWAFGITHDESQFYVPTDDVILWRDRIREVMENLPLDEFGWEPKVHFNADAEFSSDNLGLCEAI